MTANKEVKKSACSSFFRVPGLLREARNASGSTSGGLTTTKARTKQESAKTSDRRYRSFVGLWPAGSAPDNQAALPQHPRLDALDAPAASKSRRKWRWCWKSMPAKGLRREPRIACPKSLKKPSQISTSHLLMKVGHQWDSRAIGFATPVEGWLGIGWPPPTIGSAERVQHQLVLSAAGLPRLRSSPARVNLT